MNSAFAWHRPVCLALGALALAFGAQAQTINQLLLPTTQLQIGPYTVSAEIAATPAARNQGLMGRKSLPADHGMLFVFEAPNSSCFWMKNTPLPLSIAFIDSHGKIVTLRDMAPNTTNSHCPSQPMMYALEMEQGWFVERGIRAGAEVQGLPR